MILVAYFKALLLPSGRLPRASYTGISIALGSLHALAWRMVQSDDGSDVYGIYGGLLFLVMWMQFCTVSRRMHDVGRTNQMAVGLFLVIVFSYLACLDPKLLGKSDEAQEYWGQILVYVNHLVRIVWLCISVELLKQDGESGANMYGPEFGAEGARTRRKERTDNAIMAAYGATQGIARSGHSAATAPQRTASKPVSAVSSVVTSAAPASGGQGRSRRTVRTVRC